jgi:hypothetical protein
LAEQIVVFVKLDITLSLELQFHVKLALLRVQRVPLIQFAKPAIKDIHSFLLLAQPALQLLQQLRAFAQRENFGLDHHAQLAKRAAKLVNPRPNAQFARTNITLMELNV